MPHSFIRITLPPACSSAFSITAHLVVLIDLSIFPLYLSLIFTSLAGYHLVVMHLCFSSNSIFITIHILQTNDHRFP